MITGTRMITHIIITIMADLCANSVCMKPIRFPYGIHTCPTPTS